MFTFVAVVFMVVVTLALLPMAWATLHSALPYLLLPTVIIVGALAGLAVALATDASTFSVPVLGGAAIAGLALWTPTLYRAWTAKREAEEAAQEQRRQELLRLLQEDVEGYDWWKGEMFRKGQALFWYAIVEHWRVQSVENDERWFFGHQRQGYHGGAFYTPLGGFTADDARFLGPGDFDEVEARRLEEFRREWERLEEERPEQEAQRRALSVNLGTQKGTSRP